FRANSFGVSDLPRQQTAGGGGVLGSSMYSGGAPAGMTTPSGGGSGDHTSRQQTPSGIGTVRQVQVYDPMAPMTVAGSASGRAAIVAASTDTVRSQIDAAAALGQSAETVGTVTRPNLTSLAPPDASAYQVAMLKGEQALKDIDYPAALTAFEAALVAGQGTPEVLLSLTHTYLAVSEGSYIEAAGYLGRTLDKLPTLPMARVHPKDFYAEGEYDRILAALEAHVEANPQDHDAMLVLGYLRWRDGLIDQAVDVLGDAVVLASDNEDLSDAIDTLLKGIGAASQSLRSRGPTMQDPIAFPWAGIRLSLPEGFQPQRLVQINSILLAGGGEGQATRRISLTVFPIGPDLELWELMDSVTEHMNAQLGISNVTVENEAEVAFLDGQAAVRALSCEYGDTEIVGARACFIRELDSPLIEGQRLAYVLGMGVLADDADIVLPSLAAVARSIEYVDFERPVDRPVPEHGRDVIDPHHGFSIRQPFGWVGAQTERGFTMGQFDCLQGGTVTPRVDVIVLAAGPEHTAASFGRQVIETRAAEGHEITVLSHGPTQLADRDGYEFVIKKTRPATDTQAAATWTEVGRLIVVPADNDQQRVYGLVVRCRDASDEKAVAIMDAVAPTFSLSAPSE
ncbi:MAG: hypothetical protein ACYTFO_04600, partial [Planctomycetota bacterium]